MSSDIFYDRLVGSRLVSSGGSPPGSDQITTTLAVTQETSPTSVHARNYSNIIVQVSSPGDTSPVVPATCTDIQGSTYTLLKEIRFAGYSLDVFSRISRDPNVSTTITTSHQPSKHRIIVCDEWYNLGTFERSTSAFSESPTENVDVGQFHVGRKHWLVYGVLAIGGYSHNDSVIIPDDWNLLHDIGSNYGDGIDVRILIAYQISNKEKTIEFNPILGNPHVWGGCTFSFKAKLKN